MKRMILSILSTAAVVGAIAPMANAMPNRLENLHQARLDNVYLNPRLADSANQPLSQIQPIQQATPSRLDQIRQAHRDDVYLNPRQVDAANQGNRNVIAQGQQPVSRLMQMHSNNLANR